jgi:starch synthase (maltosyl-transferring)
MVHLDMPELGLDWADGFEAHDLLSGQTFHWTEHAFVRLGHEAPAHVIHVRRG